MELSGLAASGCTSHCALSAHSVSRRSPRTRQACGKVGGRRLSREYRLVNKGCQGDLVEATRGIEAV